MIRTIHQQFKLSATDLISAEYLEPVPGFIISAWLGFPPTAAAEQIYLYLSPGDGSGTYRIDWHTGHYLAAAASKYVISCGTGGSGYVNVSSWLYGWHGAIKVGSKTTWGSEALFDLWIRYIPDAEIEASPLGKPGLGTPPQRP